MEVQTVRKIPILRVRGGDPQDPDPTKRPTNPTALSRSILESLKESAVVHVRSIGGNAERRVTEAYRLARAEHLRTTADASQLVMSQTVFKADDGVSWGVCTSVFGIPNEHAK
jgi:hypothetical protein